MPKVLQIYHNFNFIFWIVFFFNNFFCQLYFLILFKNLILGSSKKNVRKCYVSFIKCWDIFINGPEIKSLPWRIWTFHSDCQFKVSFQNQSIYSTHFCNTDYLENSFSSGAAEIWNDLPVDIQTLRFSYNTAKRKSKGISSNFTWMTKLELFP